MPSFSRRPQSVYFNVKDYGAKGDGSSDDTAAIQSAHNAARTSLAAPSTVYFPAGTYVTDTIDFAPTATPATSVNWLGDGCKNTVLRKKTGADGLPIVKMDFYTNVNVPDQEGLLVEGIRFYGYATSTSAPMTGATVKVTYGARMTFRRCYFSHAAVGVDFLGALIANFYDCTFNTNTIGFRAREHSTTGFDPNINIWRNCSFVGNATAADLADGGQPVFDGCVIELNTTVGLLFSTGSDQSYSPAIIKSCWFERNVGYNIDIAADTSLKALPVLIRDGFMWEPLIGSSLTAGIRVQSRTGFVLVDGVSANFSGGAPLVSHAGSQKIKVVNCKAGTLASGTGTDVTAIAGDNF